MKCCANCEWSISPELEDEILKEQRYAEDDVNRPHAGDCAIGMEHDENYYCPSHQYIYDMEEVNNENKLIKKFNPNYRTKKN